MTHRTTTQCDSSKNKTVLETYHSQESFRQGNAGESAGAILGKCRNSSKENSGEALLEVNTILIKPFKAGKPRKNVQKCQTLKGDNSKHIWKF